MLLLDIAFALSSGGAQTSEQPGGGMFGNLFILGLIFLIFYFLLIRPNQKQQKKLVEMRENLRPGDKIITTGGIHGIIDSIASNTIVLKVAEKIKIEIEKSAVGRLTTQESKREAKKKG